MTRDETVALFLECEAKRGAARATALGEGKSENAADGIAHEAAKAHWNAWAEGLLNERKVMEADGRWAAEKMPRESFELKTPEAQAWMRKAAANFSRCLFLLRGVEGTQKTAGVEKNDDAEDGPPVIMIELAGKVLSFDGFVFPGYANFGSAQFTGDAAFSDAQFTGSAHFHSAKFAGGAYFKSAQFTGNAHFESAQFTRDAHFRSAQFAGDAYFGSATFKSRTVFMDASFKSMAEFAGHQSGALVLHDRREIRRRAHLQPGRFQASARSGRCPVSAAPLLAQGRSGASPLYRAIRRMAIQGSDYEREQMAFKGELRARRWTSDSPIQLSTWIGVLYDGIADCGRSMLRPFLLWFVLLALFPALYLANGGALKGWREDCATAGVRNGSGR